ncbi:MAG: hypothetical protein ABFR97_07030 [Thermodesulfobacteriota bacterium]
MDGFFSGLLEFWRDTNIPQQLSEVDYKGLFTNPWVLVPLLAQLGWWIYKLAFNNIIILALVVGVWIFTGTEYASGLIVNGEIVPSKILPVAGVGIGALMVAIYIFFIRGD